MIKLTLQKAALKNWRFVLITLALFHDAYMITTQTIQTMIAFFSCKKCIGVICTILFLTTHVWSQPQNAWAQKTNFGGSSRLGAVGFSIGSNGYIGTGIDSANNYLNDFWSYDPGRNAWTQKADFVGAGRGYSVGFSIGDKGYIGTGSLSYYRASDTKDFWEYDPILNTWNRKADFPNTETSRAVGFSIGSKGYIVTGYNQRGFDQALWEYDPAQDAWTRRADFPGNARGFAIGFSIGRKGYIGVGIDYYGFHKNDFWEYDQLTDTWTKKAQFAGSAREGAVGFSIGSRGYITTGGRYHTNSYKNDLWEYDVKTDSWLQKADLPGSERAYATGFSIGNMGYIGTGANGPSGKNTPDKPLTYFKDFYEYSPDSSRIKTLMLDSNSNYKAGDSIIISYTTQGIFHIGNIFTAQLSDDTGSFSSPVNIGSLQDTTSGTIHAIIPDSISFGRNYLIRVVSSDPPVNGLDNGERITIGGPWIKKESFAGIERERAVAFSIGSKGYVGTGEVYDKGYYYVADFWKYDPLTDTWTQKADFGGGNRADAVGFSMQNKGYIGTGKSTSSGGAYKDFWEYDPVTNVWTKKADLPASGRTSAVGFGLKDKGYIGTGYYFDVYLKDFWQYDPLYNKWSRKADFGGDARSSAVAFSINGNGYISTGSSASIDYYKDLWEYDPDNDVWTQKNDFGGGKRWGAVAFTIGNKGYIGTGYGAGHCKKDFWEYDPVHDTWIKQLDFGGNPRNNAVGFGIGNKGYIGTGYYYGGFKRDFWEFTPDSVTCEIPYDGSTSDITANSALVSWQIATNPVSGYRIYYRVKNSSGWNKVHAPGTFLTKTLKGLSASTTYVWMVGAKCDSAHSDFSPHYEFTTLPESENKIEDANFNWSVYPNPSSGMITLQATFENETNVEINVLDLAGRKIFSVRESETNGPFEKQFDFHDIVAGAYFIQIISGGQSDMKKILIEE